MAQHVSLPAVGLHWWDGVYQSTNRVQRGHANWDPVVAPVPLVSWETAPEFGHSS